MESPKSLESPKSVESPLGCKIVHPEVQKNFNISLVLDTTPQPDVEKPNETFNVDDNYNGEVADDPVVTPNTSSETPAIQDDTYESPRKCLKKATCPIDVVVQEKETPKPRSHIPVPSVRPSSSETTNNKPSPGNRSSDRKDDQPIINTIASVADTNLHSPSLLDTSRDRSRSIEKDEQAIINTSSPRSASQEPAARRGIPEVVRRGIPILDSSRSRSASMRSSSTKSRGGQRSSSTMDVRKDANVSPTAIDGSSRSRSAVDVNKEEGSQKSTSIMAGSPKEVSIIAGSRIPSYSGTGLLKTGKKTSVQRSQSMKSVRKKEVVEDGALTNSTYTFLLLINFFSFFVFILVRLCVTVLCVCVHSSAHSSLFAVKCRKRSF